MKTEIDLRDDAAELRAAAIVVREALEAGSAELPPVVRRQPEAAPHDAPDRETFMAAVLAAVTHGLWLSR